MAKKTTCYRQWLLKTLSLLMVAALCFNMAGHWWLFAFLDRYHYQTHLAQKAEASYPSEDLQHLSFSREDLASNAVNLDWKESHEFRYKGGMYDIAERRKTADSVHYWVKRDHEEEQALQAFKKIETRRESNSQGKTEGLLGWVKLIIDRGALGNITGTISTPPYFPLVGCYKAYLKQVFLGIELPPPLVAIR